ncbi:hypothetical protein KIN20_018367 [Parelaphostrongylus tenuis]|uniref:Uncharacterized protein n=1 Tax=Parelaphostrongylus tenuis TaxID=148309 RepID=A0AAD5MJC9_PARTN|nr:hypothetical protein KIN20_018367 [Parelaphostrongylus tenuis]
MDDTDKLVVPIPAPRKSGNNNVVVDSAISSPFQSRCQNKDRVTNKKKRPAPPPPRSLRENRRHFRMTCPADQTKDGSLEATEKDFAATLMGDVQTEPVGEIEDHADTVDHTPSPYAATDKKMDINMDQQAKCTEKVLEKQHNVVYGDECDDDMEIIRF